jgi:uncharacterized membrane protein
MVKYRKISKWIWICGIIFLLGYDILPFMTEEKGDTLTEVLIHYGLKSFTIPFGFGLTGGHFFWPNEGEKKAQPKLLIPLTILVIFLDVITHVAGIPQLREAQHHMMIWFLVALPVGGYLWAQKKV